jgi:hypothetical protein
MNRRLEELSPAIANSMSPESQPHPDEVCRLRLAASWPQHKGFIRRGSPSEEFSSYRLTSRGRKTTGLHVMNFFAITKTVRIDRAHFIVSLFRPNVNPFDFNADWLL